MIRRWMILAILLMVALPSVLYARWTKDKVYLQTNSVGKVEFSHYTHMEMESVGKNCPACHNAVFHIVTKKNPPATMAEMAKGKSCGFCHNGKKAFSVAGDCTTCHAGDIVYINEDAGNITFPHKAHTGLFGCDECHPDVFKAERGANQVTMAEMEKGESCGACHDGSTAFGVSEGCDSCHAM
jgi:c(7)-type cytochrome triheme protein